MRCWLGCAIRPRPCWSGWRPGVCLCREMRSGKLFGRCMWPPESDKGAGGDAGIRPGVERGLARHPSCSGAHLPDTGSFNHCPSLSAYSLPRFLTHSVLSGCCGSGSAAHCSGVSMIRFAGGASGSGGGYGRSACVRAIGTSLPAKVSIAAMRIPTAAATTLSSRSGVLACFSAQQHARLIGSNSKGVEPVFTKRLCSCRN